MTECSLLERTLAANLSWNRARIKFLARFLVALFAAKTVNLAHIATFFVGRASTGSHYKRIKRFLRFFEISEAEVARLVIRLMKLEPPFVITIDRTEWQLGKTWVNVLMLAIVSETGVAVPLLWTVFAKKGCSNDFERQEILEKYLAVFGVESIRFVTADREFASQEWLNYLNRRRIGFCLRIKANTMITDKWGKLMKARRMLSRGKVGEAVNCRRRRKLWNVRVRLSGRRKACGDNVIVVSSENVSELLPRLPVAMANRNSVWLFEEPRILPGSDAFNRDRENFPLAVFAGSGVLLGNVERAVCDETEALETQETRTAGEIGVSSRIRLFEAAFVPPGKQWRKARKETTYLTFVPYLEAKYKITALF